MQQKLRSYCHDRWCREGGYSEFLAMAIPLILSTGMWSVQHFINRMFLTWYSAPAIAAAMPAGMLNFAFISIFMGTVSYVDVFIAQYYGADKKVMIGPALWQGIYVALLGALIMAAVAPFSRPLFNSIGHDPVFRENEIVYFRILCFAAFPILASTVMSGFYAGRGKTWPLVLVNAMGTAVNVLLDYFLIFGNGPFPEMGIKGAAIASVCAATFTFSLYLLLVSRQKYNEAYHTHTGWRPDGVLLKRILRFGLPSGIHFFLDIAGFTTFILIMGSLGTTSLAATNIAFNISTLAFMPMIGSGIAVSVLVGQYLGKDRADLAEKSTLSGFYLTFIYMASLSLLYVLAPGIFIAPYAANADPKSFAAIRQIVLVLLRFVALYSLFDAMNIIFASAVKGAGDTHFVMRMIVVISLFVLVVPSYLLLVVFHQGIYTGWTIASAYVGTLGISFMLRFFKGNWKSMRVIERPVPFVPPTLPEIPSEEV